MKTPLDEIHTWSRTERKLFKRVYTSSTRRVQILERYFQMTEGSVYTITITSHRPRNYVVCNPEIKDGHIFFQDLQGTKPSLWINFMVRFRRLRNYESY